jgi:ribonuclease HI
LNRKVICYCDGACSNNGKEEATAGIAFWLKPFGFANNEELKVIKQIKNDRWRPTSQRAELMCAIHALNSFKITAVIEVISDSRYLTETMNGRMRKKTNTDLWTQLDELSKKHHVSWIWTARCSVPELAWCDKMASSVAKNEIVESTERIKGE